MLDHLHVRLASSAGRALECNFENAGFESHVRLALFLYRRACVHIYVSFVVTTSS